VTENSRLVTDQDLTHETQTGSCKVAAAGQKACIEELGAGLDQ
jgi:hypothetical protein